MFKIYQVCIDDSSRYEEASLITGTFSKKEDAEKALVYLNDYLNKTIKTTQQEESKVFVNEIIVDEESLEEYYNRVGSK